jgi:LmbE family N-acetylglucosaminyl deacetylase
MTDSYHRHIYLAPHLDDVVLSCGGIIAQQTAAGETVLIITIFAGTPDLSRLSPLAQKLHARWGNVAAPYTTRRAEDREAIQRLGGHFLHLGFHEAIYRFDAQGTPYYNKLEALFSQLHPADEALIDRLETALRPLICGLDSTTLYMPLTAGRHVDHQTVNRATMRLLNPPETAPSIWFYEDFPYVAGFGIAQESDTITAALNRYSYAEWQSQVIAIDPHPKIEAIACYRSQVQALFGDEQTMIQAVCNYAASLSTDHPYAERFWKPHLP